MMNTPPSSRREFLANVGRGMLVATVGLEMACDLGLTRARADDAPERLSFGSQESLVGLMQDTPVDRLLPVLAHQLKSGTDLKSLVEAAALANARTFGGEDYVGFHTMMALSPALHMARELPLQKQPLPVFKVLYRNTNRIQERGGRKNEVLGKIHPATIPEGHSAAEWLRKAVRGKDVQEAERIFASISQGSTEEAIKGNLQAKASAVVHR